MKSRYVDLLFDIPLQERFTYLVQEGQEVAVGKRVKASFGRREALGYIVACHSNLPEHIPPEKLKTISRVVDKLPLFGQGEIDLANWLASYYLCSPGQALSAIVPSAKREASIPAFLDEDIDISKEPLPLSDEQEAALKAILSGANTKNPWYYLYGITGSGKTEVFLRAAQAIIDRGQSVIYLVPEISLTHQVVQAIQERFGSASATLHSHLTASERLNQWQRIRSGQAKIVAGPRSAVFAPLQNLGLIIIDEEHDGSYKSGNTPRYHARQVALHRSSSESAILLMGSATPSVEAWKLMGDAVLHRLHLSQRLSGGSPPSIELVDIKNSQGSLSQRLKDEIQATALAGRQSILFLNRRGFNLFYSCPDCSFELNCRQCSVSLTYHKNIGRAICHYCGFSQAIPQACPSCGSVAAGFTGFGTELVEEELAQSFPNLRIQRLDTDNASKRGSVKAVLDSFKRREIDILLGTQMVAKGLNFPGVQLVGVIMADTGLQLPDFRAAERTFSLIVQVAGRAGRFFPDGKVLVQSWNPDARPIVLASKLEIDTFYRQELQTRQEAAFPPYSRLIRMLTRSKNREACEQAIEMLYAMLNAQLPEQADILGPVDCPLSRIAGNWRMHLIVRGKTMASIHQYCAKVLHEYKKKLPYSVYLETDVDPVSLL